MTANPAKTRRFTVYRRGDLSETHNANQVNPADQPQYEGVVFSDGTTVVRWLTAARSTSVWADFDTLWKIHGHDDANSKHGTVIVWHDDADATPASVSQAAVEVALAADEYWSANECKCCGSIPFCGYDAKHREANKVGRKLTKAIDRFNAAMATTKEKP